VTVRLTLLLPLLLIACAHMGDSPEAECARQADRDPTVLSIYRGDQGDYTQIGPARTNLMLAKKEAITKCMQAKGLAPPGSGVQPIRPPIY
jgi:hypothetical protein